MARDDDGLAALDSIEDAQEMRFCFGCLDGFHRFDQLKRPVFIAARSPVIASQQFESLVWFSGAISGNRKTFPRRRNAGSGTDAFSVRRDQPRLEELPNSGSSKYSDAPLLVISL